MALAQDLGLRSGFDALFSVKPPKAAASSGNPAGKVGLYPKERIGVVPTMQTSRHQGQEWIAKGEGEGKEESPFGS